METRNLSVRYGEKLAVKNIALRLPERQVTALIGPSGCGKSTFLRTLNRMNELIPGARTEGEILLDGQSVYARHLDAVELRRRVGMVFQRSNPFPKSIFENVAYGLRIAGVKDARVIAERVERSLRGAALWDEVKDRLRRERARPLGRPAAAALHRAGAGGRAGGAADGRAGQRPRPHRHRARSRT